MKQILETERLMLREMAEGDLPALKLILQDEDVMYAYEHAFSDGETLTWLCRQQERYRRDGFGLWAVVQKEGGRMIGQCGLTWQEIPSGPVVEIGYLFQKKFWHQGFAIEAAKACREYAFTHLCCPEVFSIIRENNLPSQKVAVRNGMDVRGRFVKHYYGMDMPHLIFSVRRRGTENAE